MSVIKNAHKPVLILHANTARNTGIVQVNSTRKVYLKTPDIYWDITICSNYAFPPG